MNERTTAQPPHGRTVEDLLPELRRLYESVEAMANALVEMHLTFAQMNDSTVSIMRMDRLRKALDRVAQFYPTQWADDSPAH